MAVNPITNDTEQRSATIMLNHHTLCICNEKTMDKLVEHFCEAKDLLIELYKYNCKRIANAENKK